MVRWRCDVETVSVSRVSEVRGISDDIELLAMLDLLYF
jgi:hypothetical protein